MNKLEVYNENAPVSFEQDTATIAKAVDLFVETMYPSYKLDQEKIGEHLVNNPKVELDNMTFFRIASCTVEKSDDIFSVVNEKMEKLMSALHSISVPVGFGVICSEGVTNLVLCVQNKADSEAVTKIVNGLLYGIDISVFEPKFDKLSSDKQSFGILSGVPTVSIESEKQTFSLSSVMRALNGSNYTILFLANPVNVGVVQEKIGELIQIRDAAFAVSKRNIQRSSSTADGTSHTDNVSDAVTHTDTFGVGVGMGVGASVGASLSLGVNALISAGLGLSAGLSGFLSTSFNYSHSIGRTHTTGYSDTVSQTITEGSSVSGDIQNGFALELINYADKAIERLKGCQNNGIWQTAICYSADSELSRNIIKACLTSELSKPVPDKLPMINFEPDASLFKEQPLLIPKFETNELNPVCSLVNSSELGLLCTFPVDSVPDFELRQARTYPLVRANQTDIKPIGNVCDGERPLENMPFSFSLNDLNKHTFVCGITGSGKTTTVKNILLAAQKPFLVIEPAKKEYRNIDIENTVYTLGKPELNCPQINPFYIMPGISPQAHIDFLKDLFIASFSFYGPMPYILEKCLHNVYKAKGWDLTLGFHPLLANTSSRDNFFEKSYIEEQYKCDAHRVLFPTMQDLKDEVERYISKEMKYDGEVAGNIKTAIKVRLENLCVGTKGYMFNTTEHLNMAELMKNNAVFELEGLSDDADKAFCVGLMLVLIDEYRQIQGKSENGLDHLLVIEEAHRLLKNVDTERSSEEMGNPKGKAVEHFTNVIAEMRSYGQGVIIAEQIPCKLAPDVIKNTSNKIVHRLVAVDDQTVVANTIGLSDDDAIQLGIMKSGYTLCHKEGMALPVPVKIFDIEDKSVDDSLLYCEELDERMNKITFSKVSEILCSDTQTNILATKLLFTLLAEDAALCVASVKTISAQFSSLLKQKNLPPVFLKDASDGISVVLLNYVLRHIFVGVLAVPKLPDNELYNSLKGFIKAPYESLCNTLKSQFEKLYGTDIRELALTAVVELIKSQKHKTNAEFNLDKYIRSCFYEVSEETLSTIKSRV